MPYKGPALEADRSRGSCGQESNCVQAVRESLCCGSTPYARVRNPYACVYEDVFATKKKKNWMVSDFDEQGYDLHPFEMEVRWL